jgi:tRNA pseudouridine38-40 synthase
MGKSIQSAGRTDTGVHAEGQVAAFEMDWQHPPGELLQAINANLPPDLAVRSIRIAPDAFHPRFSALARVYRYRLFCDEIRDPVRERFAWRVWPEVDLDRLNAAAGLLVGTHDFKAFGTPPRPGTSTVRHISSAIWMVSDEGVCFEIRGNAFLYHMVRRLVFFQVQIGLGRLALADLEESLDRQVFLKPGLAPPNGLTLLRVDYPVPESEINPIILAKGSMNTLAACGEDDRGQDIRP